jgi:YD repeat-containing protein
MRMMIAIVMLAGVVYGQGPKPASAGPKYDSDGHLVAYVYTDGKSDSYRYDSSWRMTAYIDREGGITTYKYNTDGSMTVVNPDGSIVRR